MTKQRYLTKSRYKLAAECPAKLYYTGKEEYANRSLEDPFLEALADGGFQVGALAQNYFPGGLLVDALDPEDALRQTGELIENKDVTLYEAAICFENLLVRVDILVKTGKHIELIEVKAKSFDPESGDPFLTNKGSIVAGWKPYIQDIAFQKYVAEKAMPGYTFSAFLMLADKNAICPTDGLNQKFKVTRGESDHKPVVVTGNLTKQDLSEPLLKKVPVDDYCDILYGEETELNGRIYGYEEWIHYLAEAYEIDRKIKMMPSPACGSCEFKAGEEEIARGLKCGFRECWKEALGWADEDFEEPTVLDIWNCRKKALYMGEGRIKMSAVTQEDIAPKSDGKPGISASERQWLQVQKAGSKDAEPWIDVDSLKEAMSRWTYPLHFIDFETSMVAIPFNRGRHPYEGIAFQFSHHVVHQDGRIEHKGQYLDAVPGKFPNYDFVRALKAELEPDQGSIFRYAAHENTYLNMIHRQLFQEKEPVRDREELICFIRTVSQSVGRSDVPWVGPRNMIDMLELVKRFYYDPAAGGSNSIKQILPALLNNSRFLQEKYAEPIYGAKGGIPSLNYRDWTWIKFENGLVTDPYKLIPKMFQNVSDRDFALLSDEYGEIREGGAAMTAYCKLQFEELSPCERNEIAKALLRYCELDTLAMVMIYEGLRELVDTT
mgnify:CR=1 FL=1